MTISKAVAKRLSLILEAADIQTSLAAFIRDNVRRSKMKPEKRARLAAKATRRESKKEETARIRAEVFARAENRCEAWRPDPAMPGAWERCDKTATIWDHWMGGTGRRRQKQSVENTWALCPFCNHDRTDKIPSIGFWNASFGLHCRNNALPFEAHIEHAPLKSSTPPVPEADTPLPDKGIGGVDSNQEQLSGKEG